MKKSFADKFLTALQSGEYEQGESTLKSEDNKFCCLGVACDVAGIAMDTEDWPMVDLVGDNKIFPASLIYVDENKELCELLGNLNDGFSMGSVYMQQILGDYNHNIPVNSEDTQNFDFDQIADFIEANLEYEEE